MKLPEKRQGKFSCSIYTKNLTGSFCLRHPHVTLFRHIFLKEFQLSISGGRRDGGVFKNAFPAHYAYPPGPQAFVLAYMETCPSEWVQYNIQDNTPQYSYNAPS